MTKYKIIPSSRTIVQSPISIGHKAEKGVEAIEFDVTAWVETYGSGTLTVIMRRWGDEVPYPVALEIDENNKAVWTLSDTDTAKAGMAYAQLSYIVGDEVVKKSDIYTFRVMDSLTGEGEPPEAYESWLEHLQRLAAEAMAEVLDIEGIVTDKTLTVDGGIADAKKVGDELSDIKADLGDYNSVNYLVDSGSKTDHGVTFTWSNNVCTFSGTSTSTALYNFVYSKDEWVDWLIRGETYTVKYRTTDSNVRLRFSFYMNGTLDSSVYIDNDSAITIPSSATGIIIRLNISSGKTVSGSCTAAMFYAMSNKELSDLCTASVGKYVAFGDSLAWGAVWDDDPSTTYYQAVEKYRMPYRIAMSTGHYGKYDNQGISGAGYVYDNGMLTSTILNYNYSGVDLITVFGGANDKLHVPLGTAESTASDGTVCGAIIEIITYLKTAAPKAKIVIIQPCPSAEDTMDNIWDGKSGGGWSLNDFDREVSKLCADNHVGYCNWNQSTYCNNWKQNSGGYSAGVGQNYSHPKSERDYALLGDFMAGKINAVSQTYDTLVNDEIDYLKDDTNYGVITPTINTTSVGLTRQTVNGKLRLYGGLDSHYTSARNLAFLNGQDQIGTSSTVFTKTLPAGTYRISFKISGVYTSEQRLRLTYSTYANSWYVYNNDIVTLDNDAVVAYRIINGVTYGNSDGSTYTEIDVSITKLTAKDDYVRDTIGNSRIVTQKMPHIISFVDDDASKTEYVTKYHDACMHNGITGNYAVLTVYLGNDYTDKDAMLGWEDEGFGMLIHAYRQNSTDHNYWIESNRDIDKCRKNLAQGLRDMQNYGFCNYKYWITPSGVHDDEIVDLAGFFGMKCLISSGQGVYNEPANSDRYFVKRASLSPAESADTRTNIAYVKSLIDTFMNDAKGGWLIITTHFNEWTGNTWDATLDANGYPIGYARFNEIAQYAVASGADIMSIPAGFSYLEPHLVN